MSVRILRFYMNCTCSAYIGEYIYYNYSQWQQNFPKPSFETPKKTINFKKGESSRRKLFYTWRRTLQKTLVLNWAESVLFTFSSLITILSNKLQYDPQIDAVTVFRVTMTTFANEGGEDHR